MANDLAVGTDPQNLIPGNPDDLDRLAARLSTFATGMVDAAERLGSIEAGEWKGPAGDAFRTVIADQPRDYDRAGDAFSETASAVSRFAAVLREAQGDAGRAIQLFEEADRQTQTWSQDWDRYDADVSRAASSGTEPSTPRPTEADPGAADRARAHQLLDDARWLVHTQAQTTTAVLAEAEEGAPKEPGLLDSILNGIGNLFGGFFKDGLWGTVTGIWDSFTALLDDPVKWIKDTWDNFYDHIAFWNWDTFASTWKEFGKDFLAWDEWAKSPMRALGQVLFNVAAGLGVGSLIKRLLRRRGDEGGTSPPAGKVHDPRGLFNPRERAIADHLAVEGRHVEPVPRSAERTPDAKVDGIPTEFKSLDPGATSATVRNKLNEAKGQARNVIIDARSSGLIRDDADRGIKRGLGAYPGSFDSIRIIGDGFDIQWP